MNYTSVAYIFGVLLMAYSLTMLPPMLVGLWFEDGGAVPFLCGFALTFSIGLIIWSCVFGRKRRELRAKDGFFVVVPFPFVTVDCVSVNPLVAVRTGGCFLPLPWPFPFPRTRTTPFPFRTRWWFLGLILFCLWQPCSKSVVTQSGGAAAET